MEQSRLGQGNNTAVTKRAVICVSDPWRYMDQFPDHSLMLLNPNATAARNQYLLDSADWSVLLTDQGIRHRDGGDYPDEKLVMYTSGTTGDSKLFGFRQDQIDRVVGHIISDYGLTANDRYASIMPIWHAHGLLFMLATQRIGCEIRFTSIKTATEIEKLQPTFVTAIPDLVKFISRLDLKNLRFVRTASQSLPIHIYGMLKKRFRVPVVEAFGMTESCSHCFTNPLHSEQRVGTIGLPSGIEFRIDDQQHLWIRGPATYYPDWFDTGDLAEQDDRGYVRILGRSIDRINVKGYKIDPLSIENQLYNEFEDIKEVAVFGRDRLKCVYVGDVDLHKVSAFLVFLGTACRPKLLQRIDEIPKNTVGKISRSLLDQHFS